MATVRQDKVQISVEIDGAPVRKTIADLEKEYRSLRNSIRQADIGTEDFVNKSKRLGEVKKQLDNARDAANSFGQQQTKLQGMFGKFGGLLKTAFAPLAALAAGGTLARLTMQFKDQATELQQLQIRFETVFGDAADSVEASAKRQATSLGLSVEQYKEAAAAAGDLLIPMGFQREEAAKLSTDVVGLSGSLSEWTGGQKSSAEVSDILTKALLGEREQLKSLGISISEADVQQRLAIKGQKEFTGQALEQAKAMATLELITEKSADAQAAFANNTGSLARQQAQLNATIQNVRDSIAKALIPAFSSALGFVNDLIGGSQKLSDQYEAERVEMNLLVQRIGRLNEGNEDRAKLISELNAKYPTFLGNLDAEKVTNQELRDRLKEVNAQYINRIILQNEQEKIQEQAQELADEQRKNISAQIALEDELRAAKEKYNLTIEEGQSIESEYAAVRKELLALAKADESQSGLSAGIFDSRRRALLSLSTAFADYAKTLNSAGDAEELLIELQSQRDDLQRRLGTSLEDINVQIDPVVEPSTTTTTGDGLTEEEKKRLAKEAEARRKEKERIERELAKYIEDLQIELMDDGLEKRLAQINLQADREIAGLKGNAEQVAQATLLINQRRQKQIADAEEEFRKKEEDLRKAEEAKRQSEAEKKLAEEQQEQQRQLEALDIYHKQRTAEITQQTAVEAQAGAFTTREEAEKVMQDRMLAQLRLYLQERIALMRQYGMDVSDLEAELAQMNLDGAFGGGGEGEGDLPEWYDKLVAGLDAARQVISAYFDFAAQEAQQRFDTETEAMEEAKAKELNAAANNARLREQIEEKYQKKKDSLDKAFRQQEKNRAITQSVIDTALAVVKALGTPPSPNVAAAAIAGTLGAIQTATIATATYASGGFTGPGMGYPDHTGYKPAGIVHQDEYVAPAWQVKSPVYRPLINALEVGRLRGYATGGPVTPVTPSNSAVSAAGGRQTMDVLREEIAGLRQDLGRIQFVMPIDEAMADLVSRRQSDLISRRSNNAI